MSEHETNRRAWDARVRRKGRFARPISDEEFQRPLREFAASGWLAHVRGKRLLCLAAGGGRLGPVYAAAGAQVTVADISGAQLELDRLVAAERKLTLRTVEASMDDLSIFASQEFDMVIQPVSTCYVRDVRAVYREVARVIATEGIYISQHKQPVSLQAEASASGKGYEVVEPYYREGPLPPVVGSWHREEGTLEYLHRWEDLLGGICLAGFVIEGIDEPRHGDSRAVRGTFAHRSQFIPPYIRIRARRVAASIRASPPSAESTAAESTARRLWTPD